MLIFIHQGRLRTDRSGSITRLPFFFGRAWRESLRAIGNISREKRPCVIVHVSIAVRRLDGGGRVWSHLVDFSGCSVATGRKPVVGGRAVHSSDSSLVGYRPSRCGERTNESYRAPSFIPPYTRERVHAHRAGLAWLAVLRSSSIGCRLLVPCTPPFVSRDIERYSRLPFF